MFGNHACKIDRYGGEEEEILGWYRGFLCCFSGKIEPEHFSVNRSFYFEYAKRTRMIKHIVHENLGEFRN